MDGYYITIEGVMGGEKTWYVGDDIEFRQVGSSVEIIENVIGSDLVARRSHSQTVSDSVENQYFIKNHLGSTVALISKEGTPAGPVFDYFLYGKQKEEVVTPETITQTFTGKEFDLFEQDTTSGDDGEGWYYFGARYYNADIGKWISVDPKREFHDSYRYTTNPIGFLDLDGMAEHVAMISASAFKASSENAIYNHIEKPMDNFKTQFKDAGSSFDYSMNFSDFFLELALKDNPDMTDLYILAHGDVTGAAGLMGDNGEYLSPSTFKAAFGDKQINVHIYACSQKGADWPSNFDTQGSDVGGANSVPL